MRLLILINRYDGNVFSFAAGLIKESRAVRLIMIELIFSRKDRQ